MIRFKRIATDAGQPLIGSQQTSEGGLATGDLFKTNIYAWPRTIPRWPPRELQSRFTMRFARSGVGFQADPAQLYCKREIASYRSLTSGELGQSAKGVSLEHPELGYDGYADFPVLSDPRPKSFVIGVRTGVPLARKASHHSRLTSEALRARNRQRGRLAGRRTGGDPRLIALSESLLALLKPPGRPRKRGLNPIQFCCEQIFSSARPIYVPFSRGRDENLQRDIFGPKAQG